MYTTITAELFKPIKEKYQLAECPVWDNKKQILWWIDIPGQQLLYYDWNSGETGYQNLPDQIGLSRLCADDCQVIGQGDNLMIRKSNGELKSILSLDLPDVRFNDGACSPDGRLFVGTMRYDVGKKGGCFYRIDNDKAVVLIDEVTVSNGLTWSLDGRFFYYIDSPTKQIDMFDYDIESGDISNRHMVFSIADNNWGVPDGMCIDNRGKLWVAIAGANSIGEDGRVICIDPDKGELIAEVRVPFAKNVTSCTFAGPDRDTLIITTASKNDKESLNSGRLFMVKPGVSGPVENRWKRK